MKPLFPLLLAAGALTATAAIASERAPNAAEQTAIESALKTAGFTGWNDIELSKGTWEVDNAVHTDGKVYDVAMKSGSYEILNKVVEE